MSFSPTTEKGKCNFDFNNAATQSIHDVKTATIMSNLESLKLLKDSTENVLKLLELQNSEEANSKIDSIKEQLEMIKKDIDSKEQFIKSINILKNKHTQHLDLPNFGAKEDFNLEDAVLSCQIFKDIGESITLEIFWHKFCLFCETNNLSEKACIKVLSSLLHGPAHEVFFHNKDKNLEDIVQALIDRFGEMHTIPEKLVSLENLSRKEGERLSSIMQKASALITSTSFIVDEKSRDARYEILMSQNLMKHCTSAAKRAILKQKSAALRAGYIMNYKSMYLTAIEAELHEVNK